MFSFTESGAWRMRARRTAFCVLISTIIFVFSLTSTYGDCPPSPTTYENGVIEGFVGEGNTTGENTITSSIGMDEGRFLIAWNGPVIVQSFPGYNRLLVHRFDADGVCICGGQPCQEPDGASACPATRGARDASDPSRDRKGAIFVPGVRIAPSRSRL